MDKKEAEEAEAGVAEDSTLSVEVEENGIYGNILEPVIQLEARDSPLPFVPMNEQLLNVANVLRDRQSLLQDMKGHLRSEERKRFITTTCEQLLNASGELHTMCMNPQFLDFCRESERGGLEGDLDRFDRSISALEQQVRTVLLSLLVESSILSWSSFRCSFSPFFFFFFF